MANGNFGGGNGTEFDPFKVEDAKDIYAIGDYAESYFIQVNDIDMSFYSNGFSPISNRSMYYNFIGSYDGGGFFILNLHLSSSLNNSSLFGSCLDSTRSTMYLRNIHFKDVISVGGGYIQCPLSYKVDGYTVDNCTCDGVLIANYGLIGSITSSKLSNLKVSSEGISAAGIVGNSIYYVDDTLINTISNCEFSGKLVVSATINEGGGIISKAQGAKFTNCKFSGSIEHGGFAGGIVGKAIGHVDIEDCTSDGTIKQTTFYVVAAVGGIVGQTYIDDGIGINTTIHRCYSKTKLDALNNGNVGGIAGDSSNTDIDQCFNDSIINGFEVAGGIAGFFNAETSSITDCYSIGTMSMLGDTKVLGGLIGSIWSLNAVTDIRVKRSYAAAVLNHSSINVGGLVGRIYGGAPVNIPYVNYWDIDVSTKSTSKGGPNIQGKSTTAMKNQSTYVGWDFVAIWFMGPDGYPELLWSKPTGGPPTGLKVLVILDPTADINSTNLYNAVDLPNSPYANLKILVIKTPGADNNDVHLMSFSEISSNKTDEMRILSLSTPTPDLNKVELVTANYLLTGA
jgi:hypothetical protein